MRVDVSIVDKNCRRPRELQPLSVFRGVDLDDLNGVFDPFLFHDLAQALQCFIMRWAILGVEKAHMQGLEAPVTLFTLSAGRFVIN